MRNVQRITFKRTRLLQSSCLVLIFLNCLSVSSQSLNVTTLQNLSFGAFSQGSSGGTVIISENGTRSVTGTVTPFNLGTPYFQAIFEIEDSIGSVVSILNGPDVTLTGSNGGTMSLHLGNSEPASPFISSVDPPANTQISIGGTLTIGTADTSPPGTYSGIFYVTFNNE